MSELSPKLSDLLDSLPDPDFAERLRKVYLAASLTISRLGDWDLLQYETSTVEDAPDLSLWETLAPVLASTVGDVNTLLTTVREEFPGGSGPKPSSGPQRKIKEVESGVQLAGAELATQVTALGECIRNPQLVSDHWALLSEIQNFRSRFREAIGELVYATASSLAEVSRVDVVPGYAEDIAAAVRVRSTVADLLRVVLARREKIDEAEPEDVQWNAQQAQKELDFFGKTPAYRALRAQDKRRVIEFRMELKRIAPRENLSKRDLGEAWAPFVEFVESLSSVNRRELLVEHDRELLAAASVKLERVESLLAKDPHSAARALAEAVQQAQGLYGKEAGLDAYLRKARKGGLEALSGPVLGQELEVFRGLLQGALF